MSQRGRTSADPAVPPATSPERGPTRLVAIVGGSGSGKSWLAARLLARLQGDGGILALDDFYRDLSHLPEVERAAVNFDHPDAIEWPLFIRCLDRLLAGTRVELPRYDFTTHTRRGEGRIWEPCPVVILDGLWLLRRAEIRRRCAVTVFVDCPEGVRLARRLARDCKQRGRTEASILRQFQTHVAPMHNRFVQPQARHADLVIGSAEMDSRLEQLYATVDALRAGNHPGLPSGRR